MNRTSAEGGLQPKEYLAKYAADRVRTISLGMDGQHAWAAPSATITSSIPFLSRDFYSMKAFFADVKETGLVPGSRLQGLGLASSRLPTTPQQQKQQEDLKLQLDAAQEALTARMQSLAAQRAAWEKQRAGAITMRANWSGSIQRPLSAQSANGTMLTIYNDEPSIFTYYDGGNGTSARRKARRRRGHRQRPQPR